MRREAALRVISLDPNIRPGFIPDPARHRARIDRMIAMSDILKMSDEDLEWFGMADMETAAKAWLEIEDGPSLVVFTRGPPRRCRLHQASPGRGRRREGHCRRYRGRRRHVQRRHPGFPQARWRPEQAGDQVPVGGPDREFAEPRGQGRRCHRVPARRKSALGQRESVSDQPCLRMPRMVSASISVEESWSPPALSPLTTGRSAVASSFAPVPRPTGRMR